MLASTGDAEMHADLGTCHLCCVAFYTHDSRSPPNDLTEENHQRDLCGLEENNT